MNPPNAPHQDDIVERAAYWCLRLHDEACTLEDFEAFEHWLHADPLHATEYARMLDIWRISGVLPEESRSTPRTATLRKGILDA